MFPFIPAECDLSVNRVAVVLNMPDGRGHLVKGECPCPTTEEPRSHVVEVSHGAQHKSCEPLLVTCPAIEECNDLFGGVFDAQLPLLGHHSREGGATGRRDFAGNQPGLQSPHW
jgi:hypothetical protein